MTMPRKIAVHVEVFRSATLGFLVGIKFDDDSTEVFEMAPGVAELFGKAFAPLAKAAESHRQATEQQRV